MGSKREVPRSRSPGINCTAEAGRNARAGPPESRREGPIPPHKRGKGCVGGKGGEPRGGTERFVPGCSAGSRQVLAGTKERTDSGESCLAFRHYHLSPLPHPRRARRVACLREPGAPDVQPAGLRVPSSTGRARCKARSSHLAQARLFWTPWKLGVAKSPGDAPRRAAPAPPPSPEPSPAQPHVAGERAWPRAPLPAARPRPGAAPPPRSVY